MSLRVVLFEYWVPVVLYSNILEYTVIKHNPPAQLLYLYPDLFVTNLLLTNEWFQYYWDFEKDTLMKKINHFQNGKAFADDGVSIQL